MAMALSKKTWLTFERVSSVGLFAVALWLGGLWWVSKTSRPVLPVELVDASLDEAEVFMGEPIQVAFTFRKNRADCHNGRLTRYVWNEHGDWIKIAQNEIAKQAPAKDPLQIIRVVVPLVDLETGKPVSQGVWAMNSIIAYDCPYKRGIIVLDDTIDTPTFEVIARKKSD